MKLPLYTTRMLDLMTFAVDNNLNGCTKYEDFLKSIGFAFATNIKNIKSGTQGFRLIHYAAAIKVYGVDANYFFTKDCTEMFADSSKYGTPLNKLKEAVSLVAAEYTQISAINKNKTRSKPSQKK